MYNFSVWAVVCKIHQLAGIGRDFQSRADCVSVVYFASFAVQAEQISRSTRKCESEYLAKSRPRKDVWPWYRVPVATWWQPVMRFTSKRAPAPAAGFLTKPTSRRVPILRPKIGRAHV